MGYKGKIVSDWGEVEKLKRPGDQTFWGNPEARRLVTGALQHFMEAEDPSVTAYKAALQHWSPQDNFPATVLPNLATRQETASYDNAFEQVFDIMDFTNVPRNGFEITDVSDSLTFDEVPVGGDAKIYTVAGEKVTVTFAEYAAGLGWPSRLIEDQEYWNLEKAAIAFRGKAAQRRAQIFYALIDAVPAAQNLAWQAVVPAALANTDPNYTAIRDIETINRACYEIVNDLEDGALIATPDSGFILLAPLLLKSRVLRALGLLNYGLAGGSFDGVNYSVRPLFTNMLASNTVYYVILPKQKAQGADRKLLTVGERHDIISNSDVMAGWMRYGGAIGEVLQFQRCATA